MAKAQWKEPPRERAFGQHPAVQQNKDLKHKIFELEERIKIANTKNTVLKNAHQGLRERLQQYESANMRYKWLRSQGVVLEYDGEFKHLKGEDMDRFFEDTPPLRDYGLHALIYAQALKDSMKKTKEVVTQTALYGNSAAYVWFDDVQDPTKWP